MSGIERVNDESGWITIALALQCLCVSGMEWVHDKSRGIIIALTSVCVKDGKG